MAIRSAFFNSVDGDRKYDAQRFAEYFATFISNGVFPNPSTGMQAISNNNMTVTIQEGIGWINGYVVINEGGETLVIDPADGVFNRIDRVILQYGTVEREIRLFVRKGEFATEAVAPSIIRNADYYELALADIYIAGGAISIAQADITDLRLSNDLCGIVHGLIEQADMTTIFNQYLDFWNTWKPAREQEFTTFQTDSQTAFNTQMSTNQAAFNTQKTTNQNAFDAQKTTNQTTFNTQLSDNQTEFNTQKTTNQTAFNTQFDDNQEAFDTQFDDNQTAFNTQKTTNQTAFDTQFSNNQTAFNTQLGNQNTSFQTQLGEQDTAFTAWFATAVDTLGESAAGQLLNLINGLDSSKVDKDGNKVLSTYDYDLDAKTKVDAIPENPKYTDTVYDDTALATAKLSKSNDVLEDYREKLVTVTTSNGIINLDLGNVFQHSPTTNIVYTFNNAKTGVHSFTLIIKMGATLRNLTFPNSIKWESGIPPAPPAVNTDYIFSFLTINSGSTWYGMFGGAF